MRSPCPDMPRKSGYDCLRYSHHYAACRENEMIMNSYSENSPRKFIIRTLCIIIILPLIGLIFTELYRNYRSAQYRTSKNYCIYNTQHIANAINLYLLDYDGYYPQSSAWMNKVDSYSSKIGEFQFHCPETPKSQFSYAFNISLSGKDGNQFEVDYLRSTPMVYESTLMVKNASDNVASLPMPPRHPEGNIIAFADGTVKQIKNLDVNNR